MYQYPEKNCAVKSVGSIAAAARNEAGAGSLPYCTAAVRRRPASTTRKDDKDKTTTLTPRRVRCDGDTTATGFVRRASTATKVATTTACRPFCTTASSAPSASTSTSTI